VTIDRAIFKAVFTKVLSGFSQAFLRLFSGFFIELPVGHRSNIDSIQFDVNTHFALNIKNSELFHAPMGLRFHKIYVFFH
jgi:hypothetical protein